MGIPEVPMRKLSGNFVPALALMSVVSAGSPAFAEPIVVTGGNLETRVSLGLARVLFEGEDFFMRIGVEGFRADLALDCAPCVPGSTVHLGGRFSFPRGSGSAVVDGVSYAQIFVDGMTGAFTSPSVQVDGTEAITIAAPFSFSGTVSGYILNPFIHGFTEPAFTKTLGGNGTASALFLFNNSAETPLFTATELRYDFGDAAPVPEPATLLLCGVGTAVLAARGRRRRGEQPHV
jgi:hypothetical protein